jgi:hypothetical protein
MLKCYDHQPKAFARGCNLPIVYVTEVHERLVPEPLAALRTRLEWSELNVYDIPGPTGRHGVLLGTMRWNASGALAGR